MIDPNTKEFHNYTDESFQYGWCGKCGHGTVLTDTDEVKEDIDPDISTVRGRKERGTRIRRLRCRVERRQ